MESTRQYQFHEGDSVVSLDGETVGKLYAVEDGYLHVEKGWLFPKDYQVPTHVVQRYDEASGTIYLSVSKDEALNSGWTQRDDRFMGGTYADEGTGATAYSGTTGDAEGRLTTAADDEERIVIPVHEEELTATKTERAAGDVQINKRVIAEEQAIDVPVTEERVNVTRRTVDRDTTTGEDVFREETIEVPLRTEDVNLERRTRVAEEIEVNKEKVQRTERVAGTVRREEVDIDDATIPMDDPERGASYQH